MSAEEKYQDEIKNDLDTLLNPLQVTTTYLPYEELFLLKIYDPEDTENLNIITDWIETHTLQVNGSTYRFEIIEILETPSEISCKWVCEIELTQIDP